MGRLHLRCDLPSFCAIKKESKNKIEKAFFVCYNKNAKLICFMEGERKMQSIWEYLSAYQAEKEPIYFLILVSLAMIVIGVILGFRRHNVSKMSAGDIVLLKQYIGGQIFCTVAICAIWFCVFYLIQCWLLCFLCVLGSIGAVCMLASKLREL